MGTIIQNGSVSYEIPTAEELQQRAEVQAAVEAQELADKTKHKERQDAIDELIEERVQYKKNH